MKSFLRRYKFHFLLVIIGLAWIEIFGFLTQMGSQGIVYPDSFSYWESAKNLYVFHRGHNYRPILMAVINGLPYLFGGSDASVYPFSFYVNLFCALASILVLFEILKGFLLPKRAFLVAGASVFLIGSTAYIFHLLTENIYLFFILLAFYFLVRYYKTKYFKWLSFSLALFVLSMLIRPGSMFLGILFSLFFIREISRNYQSKFAWFFYGSVFFVLVQCAGIKYQFGNFTISYIDAVTYYGYLGSRAESLKLGTPYVQENNPRGVAMYGLPMPEQKKRASEDLKKQLTTNTFNLFKAYAIDLTDNTKSGNTPIMDCKNVKGSAFFAGGFLFWVSKWQNRLLSIAGFLLAVFYLFKSYRNERIYSLMAFFILYVILLSGISCSQGDRFHIVTFPFVLILLAKFIAEKRRKIPG